MGLVVLFLLLVAAGLYICRHKLRKYRARREPFDFEAELNRLKEAGAIAADDDEDETVPREIRRRDVTLVAKIGEGQFGEVRVVAFVNAVLVPPRPRASRALILLFHRGAWTKSK